MLVANAVQSRMRGAVSQANPGGSLYVANLSFRTEEPELRALFAKYGEVESCRLVLDRVTRKSRWVLWLSGGLIPCTGLRRAKSRGFLSRLCATGHHPLFHTDVDVFFPAAASRLCKWSSLKMQRSASGALRGVYSDERAARDARAPRPTLLR